MPTNDEFAPLSFEWFFFGGGEIKQGGQYEGAEWSHEAGFTKGATIIKKKDGEVVEVKR